MKSLQLNVRINPQNIYILNHKIVSAEVNESHNIHLLKIMPYNKSTV